LEPKINNLTKIMPETVKIRKGKNIRMREWLTKLSQLWKPAARYALKPTDFHGITPKAHG